MKLNGQTQTIPGFGTVCYTLDASSLIGEMFVFCEKHPDKSIPVNLSLLGDGGGEHAIFQAFKNCPFCAAAEVERREYKDTRFPEGAEL